MKNGFVISSLSASAPESSGDETSGSKHADLLDDQVRNSGSNSPHQMQYLNLSYPIRKTNPTLLQSHNNSQILKNYQVSRQTYDPQTVYDIPYFRPTMEETIRGQVLPSQEQLLPDAGSSSHLSANNLKYGIQPFKPVPSGSPTGFGNFTNPTGYAINAPGAVGSAVGLEDSSRLKYKDGNLYVSNPQVHTFPQ
ncbi:hypothetical protein U1Q18_045761 [Sarracenia purpurea var. burkii]